MLKTQLKFIITIILVLGFSISLQSLIAAWQAPTATPPSQPNIYKPINVSILPQTKSGSFTTSGNLGVAGDTVIGRDLVVSNRMAINDATSSYNALKISSVSDNPAIYIDGNGHNPEIALGNSSNHWGIYFATSTGELRLWYGGDNRYIFKPNGDIEVTGKIIGDGSELTGIQPPLTQSCSEGSSIRQINDDGSVVCEIDDGAATSFDNCAYDSDSICPDDTLMRGFSGTQAYCCGSTPITCTFQDWTNTGTPTCDACNTHSCGTYSGDLFAWQETIGTDCLVETRYQDVGNCGPVSCGSCSTGYNCISGNCVCNDVCSPCGGGIDYTNACGTICPCGSTPYLFTNIAGNSYIENDVMATFWDMDYSKSKDMYENDILDKNGFAENKFRTTDEYILANNPSVKDGVIKLKIEEIEPEESYPDQFKLARVLYNDKAELIIDNQTNKLRSIVKQEEKDVVLNCSFVDQNNLSSNCLNITKDKDDLNIYGEPGAMVEFEIDTTNLKNKQVFLVINSWGSSPLPINPDYLKAKSSSLLPTFFDIDGTGNYISFNHIHPREIQTNTHLDITEVIKMTKNNKLGIKMDWTEKHWIDQVSIVTSKELEYRLEELLFTKANHSEDGDILNILSEKDQNYAHTIQRDTIDLEFRSGRYQKQENEKEAYVFISSGFYTSLRENLYPELEVDNDWQEKIDAYVEELNKIK